MTYQEMIEALFPSGAPADFGAVALLLPGSTVAAMHAAQETVGSTRLRVQPMPTTDGRWFLRGAILPDLAPGAAYAAALPHVAVADLAGVEVVPWADGAALIRRPVDINEADASTLAARLPGVGPSLADAIIAGRPWVDPVDLSSISGISAAQVDGWMADPGLVV